MSLIIIYNTLIYNNSNFKYSFLELLLFRRWTAWISHVMLAIFLIFSFPFLLWLLGGRFSLFFSIESFFFNFHYYTFNLRVFCLFSECSFYSILVSFHWYTLFSFHLKVLKFKICGVFLFVLSLIFLALIISVSGFPQSKGISYNIFIFTGNSVWIGGICLLIELPAKVIREQSGFFY